MYVKGLTRNAENVLVLPHACIHKHTHMHETARKDMVHVYDCKVKESSNTNTIIFYDEIDSV